VESDVLILPDTPEGHRPEILLENGRFRAYRFSSGHGQTPWEYDGGSGRIDAAIERHFLGQEAD
jgi:hypothetical protein